MRNNQTHRLALFIAYLALFVSTLGISIGYKHWLRIHDKTKESLSEIVQLKKQIHQINVSLAHEPKENTELSETKATINRALQQLTEVQQLTHYSAQAVKLQINELNTRYTFSNPIQKEATSLLVGAIHLLESADWQLRFFHSKKGSLTLLTQADTLLMKTGSEKFTSIREKLAHDIVALEQYPLPEENSIQKDINLLQQNITPLSELHKNNKLGKKILLFEENNNKNIITKVKGYINHSVDIIQYDELAKTPISQADRQRVDLSLTLHFQSLRLQLTSRNNPSFQKEVQRIQEHIKQYYPDTITTSWIKNLEVLQQLNINPKAPDITSALIALKDLEETDQ